MWQRLLGRRGLPQAGALCRRRPCAFRATAATAAPPPPPDHTDADDGADTQVLFQPPDEPDPEFLERFKAVLAPVISRLPPPHLADLEELEPRDEEDAEFFRNVVCWMEDERELQRREELARRIPEHKRPELSDWGSPFVDVADVMLKGLELLKPQPQPFDYMVRPPRTLPERRYLIEEGYRAGLLEVKDEELQELLQREDGGRDINVEAAEEARQLVEDGALQSATELDAFLRRKLRGLEEELNALQRGEGMDGHAATSLRALNIAAKRAAAAASASATDDSSSPTSGGLRKIDSAAVRARAQAADAAEEDENDAEEEYDGEDQHLEAGEPHTAETSSQELRRHPAFMPVYELLQQTVVDHGAVPIPDDREASAELLEWVDARFRYDRLSHLLADMGEAMHAQEVMIMTELMEEGALEAPTPVLHPRLKANLWRTYVSNPQYWTVLRLAQRFRLKADRVRALLLLKTEELRMQEEEPDAVGDDGIDLALGDMMGWMGENGYDASEWTSPFRTVDPAFVQNISGRAEAPAEGQQDNKDVDFDEKEEEQEERRSMKSEEEDDEDDSFLPPYLPPRPDRPETRPELVPFNKFTVDDRTPLNMYVNGSPRYGTTSEHYDQRKAMDHFLGDRLYNREKARGLPLEPVPRPDGRPRNDGEYVPRRIVPLLGPLTGKKRLKSGAKRPSMLVVDTSREESDAHRMMFVVEGADARCRWATWEERSGHRKEAYLPSKTRHLRVAANRKKLEPLYYPVEWDADEMRHAVVSTVKPNPNADTSTTRV